MSYTPENQLLAGPIDQILNGIDQFNENAHNRITTDVVEWDDKHLKELHELRKQLLDVHFQLEKLRKKTR